MKITRTNEVYTYTESSETDNVTISVSINKNLSEGTVNSIEQGVVRSKADGKTMGGFRFNSSGALALSVEAGNSATELSATIEEFMAQVNERAVTASTSALEPQTEE